MERQTGELERRLLALERLEEQGDDFDATSWGWLLLLGLVLPVVALVAGWFL